jgi:acetyl-CoA C-acetyltransferase
MPTSVCVISARRTPFGRFTGALARRSAVELAVHAGRAALAPARPEEVDLVVLGNVLGAGLGMNVARQVGVGLGLPAAVPAFTVNMMCASGLKAVALGAQAVLSGEARVVLCGGVESMSNAPYLLDRARAGYRIGDGVLVDSLLRDGLVDAFSHQHMALLADRLARRLGVSRQEQDAFALRSHRRYFEALAAGRYAAEIAPTPDLDHDEHPRADTSVERLAALKPSFDPAGAITAGNASGLNDGAALLLLCSEETARERGWKPLARLRAWAAVGCEPELMGLGPVHAARKLCDHEGLRLADFDTVEINEAFAAQTLSCVRELGLDLERLNPDGGAIALGHPLGASGARLAAHLAHRIAGGHSRRALATLCVGGGMGIAMAMEAVPA